MFRPLKTQMCASGKRPGCVLAEMWADLTFLGNGVKVSAVGAGPGGKRGRAAVSPTPPPKS